MSICILKHIEKKYRNGEEIEPLIDIDLEVDRGEFIIIKGPSGTGKSTLLYVIGTLLQADSGELYIDGQNVSDLSDTEKTELRASKIGFMFQDSNLIQALTLRENLDFTVMIGNKIDKEHRKGAARSNEFLDKLGLLDRANYLPHQLSGGQRRRAMIARALINSPEIILADEPTNDLDNKWSSEVMSILHEECSRGAAVIMVTHNDGLTGEADKVYRLSDGRLEKVSI